MAPVMKLFLRWEEGTDETLHTALKIKLPRSWKEGPVSNLKQTFIEHYNSKHPSAEHQLEFGSVHLLNPKGEQLADEDIVIKVLNPSDTVRVKPGSPPTLEQVMEARKGQKKGFNAAVASSSANGDEDDDGVGHVTNAAALVAAAEPKFAFDYSKWDRLDLSDEDGDDCHPNIDLESWKRLRGRQRNERRDAESKKIEKYQAKIEKYSKKVKSIKEKMEKIKGKPNASEDEAQLIIDLKDAESSRDEYQQKFDHFMKTRKMVADDVCEVKESKGLVVKEDKKPDTAIPSEGVVYPESKQKEYDSYDHFQTDNRQHLKVFAQLRNEIDTQEFLLSHPQLLCDHAEGFLLLLTLDTCMKHQLTDRDPTRHKTEKQLKEERFKEYTVGKQHLTVHYICELAKSLKRDPREAVKPFFRKTGKKAQDKIDGFEEDLTKFLDRIRKRAAEKISKGETSPLVDGESSLVQTGEVIYEPAGVGPGGLDPNEVLNSLPKDLQEAFVEQNTEKLKAAFSAMKPDEAEYHLKRCIDSGLWVTDKKSQEEDEELEKLAMETLESLPQDMKEAFESEDIGKLKEVFQKLSEEERDEYKKKCIEGGLLSEDFSFEELFKYEGSKMEDAEGEPEEVGDGVEDVTDMQVEEGQQ